jgi:HlyD family secretion protein
MKKWKWILILTAGVISLLYFLLPDNSNDNSVELQTSVVKQGDLRLTVAATGVIAPYVEVEVKSKAGGEIISFPAEEGDDLKKGEASVMLDPETEQSRVNQANADLLMTEARLDKAKINLKDAGRRLKRQQSLFEDNIISKQDLDDVIIAFEKAGSDVRIAEAEVIRSNETLKVAKDRLQDTEIKAPLTGTILNKYVVEGQVIASTTSSVSEGTLLFTMADLDRIYVRAMVDETDIGKIKPGQKASITVDAYQGKVFNGLVLRVAPKGRVESTITVFDAIIEVSDQDKAMLKPVMTANVELLFGLRKNVLLVPSEAVRTKGEETGIYRLFNEQPLWTPVSVGASDGILTEVHDGINEGEVIVISRVESTEGKTGKPGNLRRGFRVFRRKK